MIAQSVQRLVTGWTVRGSNLGGGEIFRTRPYRPWSPPSLLHNRHWVSFPGVRRLGRGVNHPPTPSSVGVKERAELYLYSPSMPSWPVLGRNLPLPFYRARRFYRASELGSSIAQTACMHTTVWLDKSHKVSALSLPTCVTTVHPLQQNT